MTIADRYARAVRAPSLKSSAESMPDGADPVKTAASVDLLGAAGLAGKRRPLAMALMRLFSGDNTAARDIVVLLAAMVISKAWENGEQVVIQVEAEDVARMVLAWHRDGVCRPCHGHGYELIEGAPSLSGNACKACRGTRKVPFESQFTMERAWLAQWLRARIEREQGFAGAAAMAALAPRLEL